VIRILIDVNLPPAWVDVFREHQIALTRASGPSVVQLRAHGVLPAAVAEIVVETLRTFESDLQRGAIVTADESRGKVRILPIR
jgi:predicted nuclease of predicted toxin-antitoxin system